MKLSMIILLTCFLMIWKLCETKLGAYDHNHDPYRIGTSVSYSMSSWEIAMIGLGACGGFVLLLVILLLFFFFFFFFIFVEQNIYSKQTL